jgi:hypothetical protein
MRQGFLQDDMRNVVRAGFRHIGRSRPNIQIQMNGTAGQARVEAAQLRAIAETDWFG